MWREGRAGGLPGGMLLPQRSAKLCFIGLIMEMLWNQRLLRFWQLLNFAEAFLCVACTASLCWWLPFTPFIRQSGRITPLSHAAC